jgi:hypothetical protein
VRLAAGMRQALDRYDPTFRVWNYDEFAEWVRSLFPANDRGALSAVLGDFNGDHQPDFVLSGRTRTDGVIVVVLSDSGRYRAVEVTRSPGDTVGYGMTGPQSPGRDTYLVLNPPGSIDLPIWAPDDPAWTALDYTSPTPGQRILQLHTDAFSVIYEEKGSALCVYAKGRFWWITSGD